MVCCNVCVRILICCLSSVLVNCWKILVLFCLVVIFRLWVIRFGLFFVLVEDVLGEVCLWCDLVWVGQQFQQCWVFVFVGVVECGGEVGVVFYLFGVGVEGLCQGDEVGVVQVGGGYLFGIFVFLMYVDGVEYVVVDYDYYWCCVELCGGCQFLWIYYEIVVVGEVYYVVLWIVQVGGDCGGQVVVYGVVGWC